LTEDGKIKAVIIGAGEMADALCDAVTDESGVVLTGIVTGNTESSQNESACRENVPLFTDIAAAMQTKPDLVIDLTGSDVVASRVKEHKPPEAEIITSQAVRFFLQMMQEEHGKRHAEPDRRVMDQIRELREINHELTRLNKVKSEFIATMSHELRTPLNSILGFSELLRDDNNNPLTDKQKHYAVNIHNSGNHLLQLINNLLDLAKIESGKFNLQYESIPLRKIVSEVDAVIRPLVDKKAQHLEVRLDDAIHFVRVDRMKFTQILYNLLSNAMKFTAPEGQITMEAEIRTDLSSPDFSAFTSSGMEIAETYLVLRVRDTGIGIRQEDQDRIFSEFEQVGGNREGTGLGLALTKKLVEHHGGRIAVASQEGQGSVFTVVIPQTMETLPQTVVSSDELSEDLGEEEEEDLRPETERRGALVLLVEDDAATAELMSHYLTEGGYRVAHVFNGADAVKQVREAEPFAVILDIMLPGKNGWQILQELQSDDTTQDIPVIILSIIDNRDLGFALGAADYLIKPVKKETLLGKLQELNLVKSKGRRPVNILCIDDNEGVRELLKEILETEGYDVISAATGKDGVTKALQYRPDLIILDLLIPDMDGFELSQALKSNTATADIPIIVLTAKDITVEERLRLVGNTESIMQKSCFSKEDLLAHIRDLEATYPVRMGLLDKVSGLFDRSYFQIRLAQEIYRADRYYTMFSIMMVDIDDFIEYTQANGVHNANICIRKVADFLRQTTRGSDILVRYGVGEFAMLLSSTTEEGTHIVAQRLLSFIESYHFPGVEKFAQKRMTASIAAVHYNRIGPCAPEQMISVAQEMIREAKKTGGGNIQIYGQQTYSEEDTDI
jgi:diguanylate cyclase (GGDEF)-like protein